jgi:hypothetical protein
VAARETWVRPPVVAAEAPSRSLALWRYRVLALVLLLLVLAGFVWLFLTFSDVTGGEDPGIGVRPATPAQLTAR